MSTAIQNRNRFKPLAGFIGPSQAAALASCLAGEEGGYFDELLTKLGERIATMPKSYEQDGKGKDAIVYLHYFKGRGDWYITEKDLSGADDGQQHQVFGYADLGYGSELGYISIAELIKANVEIDLYFEPQTVGELKAAGKIR